MAADHCQETYRNSRWSAARLDTFLSTVRFSGSRTVYPQQAWNLRGTAATCSFALRTSLISGNCSCVARVPDLPSTVIRARYLLAPRPVLLLAHQGFQLLGPGETLCCVSFLGIRQTEIWRESFSGRSRGHTHTPHSDTGIRRHGEETHHKHTEYVFLPYDTSVIFNVGKAV